MTPYSRVLKNLRICMFYPKFCMFSIQIDIFCFLFKVILTRDLNFLTDNQYGPCKSRVLICNINTPLSGAQKTDIVDFLQSYLLNFQKVNCPNTPDQPTAKYQERKKTEFIYHFSLYNNYKNWVKHIYLQVHICSLSLSIY